MVTSYWPVIKIYTVRQTGELWSNNQYLLGCGPVSCIGRIRSAERLSSIVMVNTSPILIHPWTLSVSTRPENLTIPVFHVEARLFRESLFIFYSILTCRNDHARVFHGYVNHSPEDRKGIWVATRLNAWKLTKFHEMSGYTTDNTSPPIGGCSVSALKYVLLYQYSSHFNQIY